MTVKLTVYMADLRHFYGGVLSADCVPLAIGYMKAVIDRDLSNGEVDVDIFAYPNNLLAAIRQQPPDVLMVSNYVWNESLSLFMCRHVRQLNPDVLTIMGGPNINVEPERQIDFVHSHPELDIYALGESDFLACDLLKRFLASGRSKKKMLEQPLPSCVRRRPDGEVIRGEISDNNFNINDIPSPWLAGIFDKFFDDKFTPIIETNRGCPFQCSFCVQGSQPFEKMSFFELDRLREELQYIGKMINDHSPHVSTLRITDANFGMYQRDLEISEYIGEVQRIHGWPLFIDATTGKNRADLIIRAMEKVNGALMLCQAVQSMDDKVLHNVRRSNIKLEAYEEIQVYVRERGLRSVSDLILGLPGESMTTHLAALHKLIDAGTNQAHCFQAMMLKGADMESLETRKTFKFDVRYRVLPKNYGIYEGEKVFDIEEIVVATDKLPFNDYIKCRMHHLAFSVFWNDSWFDDVVQFARLHFLIKPSEWLVAMFESMESDQGEMRKLRDDFVDETLHELFPSREACHAFYAEPENFERLCRGEIGDNLVYKYRAKVSFFIWPQCCACAMESMRRMVLENGADDRIEDFEEFWHDFHAFIEAKHAFGSNIDEILSPTVVKMRYDIQQWIKDGMDLNLSTYRHDEKQRYLFRLSDDGAGELRSALNVWTAKLAGLTKLVTRIRISSQVRSCKLLTDNP